MITKTRKAFVADCVFLVARYIVEKTLPSVNENRNQKRKLNSPDFFLTQVVESTIILI